jgi:hypothetical protein
VLLAVFLGFWTWCYTYKRDAWKFWLNFALTLVTFGLFVVVAWIWAIIDVSFKSPEFYRDFSNNIDERVNYNKISIAIGSVLTIVGIWIAVSFLWYLMGMSKKDEHFESNEEFLWMVVLPFFIAFMSVSLGVFRILKGITRDPNLVPAISAQPGLQSPPPPPFVQTGLKFYYSDERQQAKGPFGFDELLILEKAGALKPDTNTIEEGASEWTTWSAIKSKEGKM